MRRLKSSKQHTNATTTTVCMIIPAATSHSSLKRKNQLFLPVKAVLQQLRLNQLQTRFKMASLVTTQIAMASACSPQLIQKRFLQVPLHNVAMGRTASAGITREHVHITEELRDGWANELCQVSAYRYSSEDQREFLCITFHFW